MRRDAAVEVRGLTWRPAARRQPVLRDLDLSIAPGERVLLAGPSGAGKSTLLRAIAGVLLTADVGDLAGEVRVDGADPHEHPGRVALLLQDPTASLVAERIGRDVAFGLENLRLPREQIWPQVAEALTAVGLPYPLDHRTHALSGGETQRLALAGALAMRPGVLLLDEPTSMLDPGLAAEVRAAVADVVRRRGSTLVVVEHRMEGWVDLVDRVVVLDEAGAVVADGPPDRVLAEHRDALLAQGVWVPGAGDPKPADIDHALVGPYQEAAGTLVEATEIVLRHTWRTHTGERRITVALDGVCERLDAGRILAVTGASGAGKSTLVSVLGGLARPTSGAVHAGPLGSDRPLWKWRSSALARRLAWVPQQPEHAIVARTVLDEVLTAARATDRESWARRRADALLQAVGVAHLAAANPYQVSGGEQRRIMLAAALAHGPQVLLLDEPTVGQDRTTWSLVAGLAAAARDAGVAVGMATHDLLAVDTVGDRHTALSHGRAR
ncbi:MAG TPA: ATP-binding cassette domain-containing protein [Nocardioidaceae bacterium]|nr:ATP-binding cassette domain-containing protein [Nocardioidaceae bacterium]